MKNKFLLLILLLANFAPSFAQGLIIHKPAGLKDTVVISTVDSVTFTQSLIVHRNTGTKDSVQLSGIDSLSYDATINPAPVISALTPPTVTSGNPDFVLVVTGKNFFSNSVLRWNGADLNTDFVSNTELQALIPAANVATAAAINITVFTPAPGGGSSPVKTFNVATVTITKEGFETGAKTGYAAADVKLSTGTWTLTNVLIGTSTADVRNGNASARIHLAGKMTMKFDLTSGAGTVSIQHAIYGTTDAGTKWGLWYSTDAGSNWTQADSLRTTNTRTFQQADFTLNISGLIRFEIRQIDSTVNRINMDDITITSYGATNTNPLPIISSLSPSEDTVAAPQFTLTVTGSNFISSSVVVWNGKNLVTTYVSATQLQAIVPSSYLPSVGTANVTVFTTNGGSSAPLIFTITQGVNSPVPVIKSYLPPTVTAGNTPFTLTVSGSNFVKTSVVKWNSVALATTYVSATLVQAQVTADLVASTGTANITVYTAPPSGGTTVTLPFVVNAGPLASNNINLTMGNPSSAVHDTAYPRNYLIERGQYCTSYNRDKGIPNWTSWELDQSWIGSASRGSFMPDTTLPFGWYVVATGDYSGTGFSRGHMCPSADRTKTQADNDTLFYMTNMIPQTQAQNGGPWGTLEGYCRTLAAAGNKLYIYSGPYGEGGTGLNGYATSIASGRVTVPSKVWKVIMVLPAGTNDVSRVTTSTRCIAVIMNNDEGPFTSWTNYRVSVDSIEALTGYDFFPNVPKDIQATIEAVVDNQ